MTLVNVISSIIYTKGFPLREKIQLHVMAVLFLVLLYNSPSGLVLYWTLNNVFSLIKNLFCKLKNPLKVFYFIVVSFFVGFAIYYIFCLTKRTDVTFEKKLLVGASTFCVMLLPLVKRFIQDFVGPQLKSFNQNKKYKNQIFLITCIGLFLLAGIFIPSSLTQSDPVSFSFVDNFTSPLEFLHFPLLQAMGFFLVWIPVVYLLISCSKRNLFTWIMLSIFLIAIINVFILQGNYGFITSALQFTVNIPEVPAVGTLLLDCVVVLGISIATLFLIKCKCFKAIFLTLVLISTSLLVMGISNYISTQKSFKELSISIASSEKNGSEEMISPLFNLSKTEENVLVMLIDMAVGDYAPYVFQELPETKKQFAGFTFYPNTVSSGTVSAAGTFAPYGGYEYTVDNIVDEKNNISHQKTSEVAEILPHLFLKEDFTATMIEVPADYGDTSQPADLEKVMDTIPLVDRIKLNPSLYKNEWKKDNLKEAGKKSILETTLINFSMFRMFPPSFRGGLYTDGYWWKISNFMTERFFDGFMTEYAVLHYLPELTDTTNTKGSFTYFYNATPHMPVDSKYIASSDISSSVVPIQFDDQHTNRLYNANYLTYEALGKFFDYLRANDVYDNTRIILVSDHGGSVYTPSFDEFDIGLRPAHLNCILMMKDFYSSEPIKTDMTFMTNADVPQMALQDIVENPVNPFTGKSLLETEKEDSFTMYQVNGWSKGKIENYNIWNVKENIFDPDNWTRVE